MKLIVGLGNPGREYANTRHNIGFMCIDHFAREHGIKFDAKQGQARVGRGEVSGEKVVLARPQTFMNASGESVRRLLQGLKLGEADLIVIHDDLDLPVGRIRIRAGGSSGGHKGIRSIIALIGTPDFTRIKVGIGRPGDGEGHSEDDDEVIDYVLSGFTGAEKKIVAATIPIVSDALEVLIAEGLEAAMNKYNAARDKSAGSENQVKP